MHFRRKRFFILSLVSLLTFIFFFTSLTSLGSEHYKKPIQVKKKKRQGVTQLQIETALTNYLFSTNGGNIRSIFLHFAPYGTKRAELISATTTNPEIMNRSYLQNAVFPGTLKINGNSDKDLNYSVQVPEGTFYDKLTVTFVGTRNNLKIIKEYTIYNTPNYTLEFDLTLVNTGKEPIQLNKSTRLYVGSFRSRENKDNIAYLTKPTATYIFDGEVSTEIFVRGGYNSFGGSGYVGKNLVLFLKHGKIDGKPSPGTKQRPSIAPGSQNDTLYVEFGNQTIASGESSKYFFSLYAGRRRHVLLSNVGLAMIDETGFFSKLLVPVINFLHKLYEMTGNYAWAIILFTILIRVLLYPLMRNMYHSMAKMQELQPKLQEIREEYEDDRQKQQEKMMEIYQEEGVNPMGGCLPMFIQLPILIVLWRAILYSAEQIHLAPGFLWIPDLALHDPYYILVILTVATMVLQQQLMQTPGGGGAQSKWMGLIFPLFMGVMLHNFPAGLWLYYFLTTLFQVGQQAFINWEMEQSETEEQPT